MLAARAPNDRSSRPTDRYWPTLTGHELAAQVLERWEEYHRACEASGRVSLWRRAVNRYYGLDDDGKRSDLVTFAGTQGELVQVSANHYRSLIKHILVMATQQRPALQARASNSDYRSLAQTKLAEGLLDYYLSEVGVEDRLVRCAEIGLLVGEADVLVEWSESAGRTIATEVVGQQGTGEMGEPLFDEQQRPLGADGAPLREQAVHEGDVEVTVFAPWDVARDLNRGPEDSPWKVLRVPVNKWDLASRYPEYREQLLSDHIGPELAGRYVHAASRAAHWDDDVWVYKLYVRTSDALPDGRHAIIAAGCTLFEGPLPYDEIPSYTFCPTVEIGAGYSYSDGWDLLGLQQIHDSILSTMVTNHDAFGVQNIAIPDGANISAPDTAGGMRVWHYNAAAGEPKAIQLLRIGDESFKLEDVTRRAMETISGVNSVARGDLPDQVKSGSYAALVQSMAIQFNSAVERAVTKNLERVGTGILRVLQRYAKTQRVAEIAGKQNRAYVREWSADEISDIRRVVVDVGAALQRTTPGKADIADKLLERGMIQRPEQYFEVLRYGTLDPVMESPLALQLLLRSENEALAQGQPAPTLVTDAHDVHIAEHLAVLNTPEVRLDEKITAHVLEHVKAHVLAKQQVMMDPILASIAGMPPPPMPGGPGPGGANGGANGGPPVDAPGAPPPAAGSMPQMPVEPLSGERVEQPS